MRGCPQSQTRRPLRRAQVRTYDVVPVSGSLGLVEFVPGTLPLKEAIAAQLEPQAMPYSPSMRCTRSPMTNTLPRSRRPSPPSWSRRQRPFHHQHTMHTQTA